MNKDKALKTKYQTLVINDCYGGFGLSLEAKKRYLKLKGKKAYFFVNLFGEPYRPLAKDDSDSFVTTFTVPNPNDYLKDDGKKWLGMNVGERKEYNQIYNKINFYEGDLKRDDPLLVQVVEELGKKASGVFSKLKIVKIPLGIEYEIEEYDGHEWVSEKHRTWE